MTRKRVKLGWIVNDKSRAITLKKRRLGLLKKVRELTTLCGVMAFLIIFSPNKVAPMVWQSAETAHDLLDDFFALPEVEKKKKETSLESYFKEKTRKVHEKLKKLHKKNMDSVTDQLMLQLYHGRAIVDLNMNEIHGLLSFSRDNTMLCRKRRGFAHHPPLRDPPMQPFEAQSEELRTTINDLGPGQGDERTKNTDEAAKKINIGSAVLGNQGPYLMDLWSFLSSEPPNPIHQPVGMEIRPSNENVNPSSNETTTKDCDVDAMSFDLNRVWSENTNHHSLIAN